MKDSLRSLVRKARGYDDILTH
uniref:Uncharacterized protein n=1 Tax=Rhizophora mucronata TaxID=61149 RepID=A0A2P2PRZ6_RHIMU